jgi:hypothetical protein
MKTGEWHCIMYKMYPTLLGLNLRLNERVDILDKNNVLLNNI